MVEISGGNEIKNWAMPKKLVSNGGDTIKNQLTNHPVLLLGENIC